MYGPQAAFIAELFGTQRALQRRVDGLPAGRHLRRRAGADHRDRAARRGRARGWRCRCTWWARWRSRWWRCWPRARRPAWIWRSGLGGSFASESASERQLRLGRGSGRPAGPVSSTRPALTGYRPTYPGRCGRSDAEIAPPPHPAAVDVARVPGYRLCVRLIGAPTSLGAFAPGQEQAPRALREAGLTRGRRLRRHPAAPLAPGSASTAAPRTPTAWRRRRARWPSGSRRRSAPGRRAGRARRRLHGRRRHRRGRAGGRQRVGLVYFDMHPDLNTPETVVERHARLDGRRAHARPGRARPRWPRSRG